MSFVLGIVPFQRLSETLVQRNSLCFFSSMAAHDSRIFTIAKIGSPDKEIAQVRSYEENYSSTTEYQWD